MRAINGIYGRVSRNKSIAQTDHSQALIVLPRCLLHGQPLSSMFVYSTPTFPFLVSFSLIDRSYGLFFACLLSSRCATRGRTPLQKNIENQRKD